MPLHRLSDMTWPEVAALPREKAVAILPIGATEAHGPHLPTSTDVILAEGMAEAGAQGLAAAGWEALLLPPLAYTSAPFAAGFEGTLSIHPATTTALIIDIVRSLWDQRFRVVALANAHFDPSHIGAIYAAVKGLEETSPAVDGKMATATREQGLLVYPDMTRRRNAERLTDEFRSGACHAGCYEGSMVMARRPGLVRMAVQESLPARPISLSRAIREGKSTFEEAGGDQAYFGDPASSSATEGRETFRLLGEIMAEAVQTAVGRS